MLSPEEMWQAVEKKAEWQAIFKGQLLFETRYDWLLYKEKKPSSCMAGYLQLGVSADGYFYPCAYMMDLSLGNITRDSLVEVWQNSPTLKALRSPALLIGICATCVYKDSCRGGCRGLAYLMEGDYLCPDPYCPLVAQANEKMG